jgi:heme-degrading monooxygenase HmoA
MYARLTTIEGLPDRMGDATRHVQEQTLPQLRQMDGFKGFVALGDRQSGRLVGVAFWESEEALRATEQAVSDVRSGAAQAVDGSVASVEQYEVVVYEAPSTGPVSGVTDTVGGAAGNLLAGGKKRS